MAGHDYEMLRRPLASSRYGPGPGYPSGFGFGAPGGAGGYGAFADDSAHGTNWAGRGPSRYRRSDERVHDEVCEALTRHPRIDPSDVEIEVSDGEVTLRGTVASRSMKRMAVDLVERVPGVLDVHTELRTGRRH